MSHRRESQWVNELACTNKEKKKAENARAIGGYRGAGQGMDGWWWMGWDVMSLSKKKNGWTYEHRPTTTTMGLLLLLLLLLVVVVSISAVRNLYHLARLDFNRRMHESRMLCSVAACLLLYFYRTANPLSYLFPHTLFTLYPSTRPNTYAHTYPYPRSLLNSPTPFLRLTSSWNPPPLRLLLPSPFFCWCMLHKTRQRNCR